MSLSLHAAFVPGARQMLGAVEHLIGKAESWCADTGCEHAEVVGARLHEDMLPFAYQVKSVTAHSAGALEGVRLGVFSPDLSPPPTSFADLRAALTNADAMLAEVSESELDGFVGGPMRFEMKDFRLPFTAENFLLSFSQPNLYFHAATAYNILRMKGVPLGKRDFLGQLRIQRD